MSCDWSRAAALTSDWSLGRSGQYEFPKPEWTSVSEECKSLIRKCLRTNPDERPSIDQVIESKWISVNILLEFLNLDMAYFLQSRYLLLQSPSKYNNLICPSCH